MIRFGPFWSIASAESGIRYSNSLIASPGQLLEALANKLGTTFAVVKSDAELRQLRQQHVARGEVGFATLEEELAGKTYGITLRKRQRQMWEPEFVSVIDCRGDKSYRENYTKWHEMGHLLIMEQRISQRVSWLKRRTHCSEAELRDPRGIVGGCHSGDICVPA